MKNCENCKYCQKRWVMDKYGNHTTGYYGCNYPPHWGKHVGTIGVCPKEKELRE